MQNLDYFKSLTVARLKSILSDFNATGLSKLRKPELVMFALTLMDGAHLDAIAYAAQREAESIVASAADAYRTEVVERNSRRLKGYASQVGKNRHGGAAFTAKQRKRMISKAERAQKIWTTLMINEGRTAELSK
jgi:hypothetical protein